MTNGIVDKNGKTPNGRWNLLVESLPNGTKFSDHIQFNQRVSHHARNEYFVTLLTDWARELDNFSLISIADGGPWHFGGNVNRNYGDEVIINVYTD